MENHKQEPSFYNHDNEKMELNEKEKGKIIEFKGVEGQDVYNITAPFMVDGKECIAGRVEKRDSLWQDSDYKPKTIFFTEKNGVWTPMENTPILPMEDPFITFIHNELIIGGVEVFGEPEKRKFKTVFYKGKNLNDLEKFASGPEMMKDIRLVELSDGRIGVFTRPQGKEHKRGRIGFTIIDSLSDLKEEKILEAKIIENKLKDNEWEGVNIAVLLESGKVGALAHRAYIEESRKKNYQATSFVLNPSTLEVEKLKIIAERSDFEESEAKCSELKNVVFPGGIVSAKTEGYCYLYAGLSDASSGVKKIENPFGENFKRRD